MKDIRLGVLVPAGDTAVESELYKMAPSGVTIHFARLYQSKEGLEARDEVSASKSLDELYEDSFRAAESVSRVQPKVIGFACTSGSFFKGNAHNQDIINQVEAGSEGIPAITTSAACLEALRELNIKRVCYISPYPQFMVDKATSYLEENGFVVVSAQGLNLSQNETSDQSEDAAYDVAMETQGIDYDGIFCSCTAWRTVDSIEKIEQALDKPMISASQATMWKMLKIAGYTGPISGFGQLMKRL